MLLYNFVRPPLSQSTLPDNWKLGVNTIRKSGKGHANVFVMAQNSIHKLGNAGDGVLCPVCQLCTTCECDFTIR